MLARDHGGHNLFVGVGVCVTFDRKGVSSLSVVGGARLAQSARHAHDITSVTLYSPRMLVDRNMMSQQF